jgi:hypothetical protein
MPLNNSFREISGSLKARVKYFLNKLYIFSRVKDVSSKVNNIVSKAEISAQSEMVRRTLAEREARIAKELRPQRDIRQAKDWTRQNVHTALIKGEKNDKARNKMNAFTK